MPSNPTREDFARLVLDLRAELGQVTEGRRRQFFTVPRRAVPKSWEAYPWARDYAGVEQVMNLTGLSRNSVRLFDSQARVARRNGHVTHSVKVKGGGRVDVPRRLMPPSVSTGRHRRWMLGELALWMAIREDRQAVNQAAGPDITQGITQVREIHERDREVTAEGVAAELGVDPAMATYLIAEAGLASSAPSTHYASDTQLLDAARKTVQQHWPDIPAAAIGKIVQIAQVREIHARDGEVTGKGISAELGVDPALAAHLIAEAGLKSSAPEANYASDSQLLDVVREAVRRHGPGVEVAVIGKKIQAAGLHAAPRRIGPALIRARAEHVRAAMEPSSGAHGAELESLRADGLVTGVQIAEAFGITEGAVTQARKRREIRTVKWEPYGGDDRPLYDPARLAVRKDGQKGPVDMDSPLAVKMEW